MVSLSSRVFRNNKTGETIRVIDTFEDIAVLENRQKISVSQLLDTNQYTEQIDPNSFFNNQEAYNALAEKLKSIPTENLVDDSLVDKFGGDIQPSINESAIIQTTEEDEMAELAKKYGVDLDASDAVAKQRESFSKYLEDEIPVEQPRPQARVQQAEIIEGVKRVVVEDPIISMFRNVKRSVDFSFDFSVSEKIPRLDFIEMMEDSYEISIIDFLSDEFTNRILRDPSVIKSAIKNRINELVYGSTTEDTIREVSSTNVQETSEAAETKKPNKPTAKERIELISKIGNISSIEFQLKGEKSKSVIEAGKKRIEEIKSKR